MGEALYRLLDHVAKKAREAGRPGVRRLQKSLSVAGPWSARRAAAVSSPVPSARARRTDPPGLVARGGPSRGEVTAFYEREARTAPAYRMVIGQTN